MEDMEKKENRLNRGKAALVVVAVLAAVSVIAALCIALGMEKNGGTHAGSMVVDTRASGTQVHEPEESPLTGRNVYFSGFGDAVIASGGVVQLDNREENLDFMLRYEIYDAGTGELVFETDLIPSGQHVDWMPGEALKPGEYTLNFLQIPYYPDPSGEYIGLTQGSNQITLAILDE